MTKQKQFVRGTKYRTTSPSGNEATLEHIGNFKLDGEKILMFKPVPPKRAKKTVRRRTA